MKQNSGSKLINNYFFNAIYSILNILLPIVTIPYVSRILLSDGVGEVSFIQNISTYFLLFASLGIPNYGIREISKTNGNPNSRSKTFTEIFLINSLSSIISFSIFVLCAFCLPLSSEKRILMLIFSIPVILNVFNVDWYYRGIENFKYITIRNFLVKTLSLVCIFAFVRQKNNEWVYALILALSNGLNYVLNIFHARKEINFRLIDKISILRRLKPIFFMFVTAAAVELYTQLDTTMIGLICSDGHVGYYSNSNKIVKMIITLVTAIGTVVFPRFNAYLSEKDYDSFSKLATKAIGFIVTVSVPACVGIFLVSDGLVKVFFGDDFLPSISTIKILCFLIPIISLGNIFGTQILLSFHQEKKMTISVLIGCGLNIVLNSVLIRLYQHNGAAFASVITELIVLLIQIHFSKKYFSMRLNILIILKTIYQVLAMGICVYFISYLEINLILKLTLQVSLGAFSYCLTGIILRNECFDLILRRFVKK